MKTLLAIPIFLFSTNLFSQEEIDPPKADYTPVDSCSVYLSSMAHSGYGCVFCYDYNWGVITDCELDDFSLAVYNRWGIIVYKFENQEDRWFSLNQDGQVVPQGTYYWVLSYTSYLGHEVAQTGYVTVMR
ncbi:gliding motility-associated C-terminal domain-containing protein [Crocinitomix catalasitica]|nr:gliding motility-associated C-terminal domain-containing protein [Crocinitomix catalasitica]